jgi:hypothetical protein
MGIDMTSVQDGTAGAPGSGGVYDQSYINDFRLFSTVYRFFSSLCLLGDMLEGIDFDLGSLESDILACNANGHLDEIEIEIAVRISLLRQALESFDAELPVATLRHHFEQLGVPDPVTLEMLLSFYLSKSVKTESDRNKIELISTWWGRFIMQARESERLPLSAPSLRERLEKIYHNIGITPMPLNEIEVTLKLLDYEGRRLLTVRTLRELIDRKILNRLRNLKVRLGDLLFQPAILSEVIMLNIGLHNTFRTLFVAEQSRVSTTPPVIELPALATPPSVAPPSVAPPSVAPPTNTNGNGHAQLSEVFAASSEILKKADQAGASLLAHRLDGQSSQTITLDRADLLKVLESIRTVILVLDQHLQPLIEKLEK